MRRIVLLSVVLLISNLGFAAKLDKGFEALEMFNYFEAKKIFEKSLKNKTAGAAYGLCKVYDAEKSPFFNVDTAFKFLLICDSAFTVVSDKEKLKLKELEIDSASILQEKKYLATFFFTRATENNTLEAYQEFIEMHPEASEYQEAIKLRNHAAYLVALKVNSIELWTNYLQTYPNSNDYLSAKKQLQILEYKLMTEKGDAESFRLFVAKYPDNPYIHDAQEMVYQMYTQDKKLESYELFIKENPSNKNVSKAWKIVYKMRISKFAPSQIYEFMIDYPNFPNKELLRNDLQLSMTQLFPVQKNKLWGYIDTTGTWFIKPQFSWASPFSEGKALVGFMGKTVFIDKHGTLIFKHLFADAEGFSNLLATVEMDDQYGVINYLGDTIIPIIYDELGEFSEGLIYAGLGDSYGYFNTQGEIVIPFEYSNAFDFTEGLAIVKSDSGYGVINDSGRVLIPTIYEMVLPDSTLCIVKSEDKYGVLTYDGDTLVAFDYDAIGKFTDNRAIAANGDIFNYINTSGEIAIEESFGFNDYSLNYSAFTNGYALVFVKGRVGIIDTLGKRVYPAIFNDVGAYNGGLTAISKGKGWGYANEKVKLIIPYQYKYANDFKYGYAVVENDTSQGLINGNNEQVIAFGYDEITQIDSMYLLVDKNGVHGIMNYSGDTLLDIQYETIEWVTNDILMVYHTGMVSIYNLASQKFIYKEENE